MPLNEYDGKIVESICSFLPKGKEKYWLTVYTHRAADLTRVTDCLEGRFKEIDEGKHLVAHNSLHAGEDYQDASQYLMENIRNIHKHYKLGAEDQFDEAVKDLETLIK